MQDYPYSLTSDLVFKAVFGSNTERSNIILIDLLNSILEHSEHQKITSIIIQNPFIRAVNIIEKKPVLDIKAKLDNGELINIEVQVRNHDSFIQRMVYYLAKLHVSQLEKGERYSKLKKTIHINITSFQAIEGNTNGHLWYRLKECQTHEELTDDLELHCVQLPYVYDIINMEEVDSFTEWMTLIKGLNDPVRREIINTLRVKKEVINMAIDEYNRVTSDDIIREQIEAYEKAEHDVASWLYDAEKRGIEKGITQGLVEGINQGKETMKIEMARKLLQVLDNQEIADSTGLDIEFIQTLREE